MSRPMSRRTAAKLLLAAPAALAMPVPGSAAAASTTPRPSRPLSAAERRQLDKSVAQLRAAAGKIRELTIPIGTEPAFVFRPLLSKE